MRMHTPVYAPVEAKGQCWVSSRFFSLCSILRLQVQLLVFFLPFETSHLNFHKVLFTFVEENAEKHKSTNINILLLIPALSSIS